jgi:hypothetical protein
MDLWRQLEKLALDGLRAKQGVLTIDRSDRSQRNMFLSLERLVSAGTLARVAAARPFATYQLLEPQLLESPLPESALPK